MPPWPGPDAKLIQAFCVDLDDNEGLACLARQKLEAQVLEAPFDRGEQAQEMERDGGTGNNPRTQAAVQP